MEMLYVVIYTIIMATTLSLFAMGIGALYRRFPVSKTIGKIIGYAFVVAFFGWIFVGVK